MKSSRANIGREDLGDTKAGYEELIEKVVDDYRIVFRRLAEDSGLREYMQQNDIEFIVLEES